MAFIGIKAAPDVPAEIAAKTEGKLRSLLGEEKALDLWQDKEYEKAREELPERLRGDCRDRDCLAEIGQAVKLGYIIYGELRRSGQNYEVEIRLLDVVLKEDFAASIFMQEEDIGPMMGKVVARFGEKVPEFERGREEAEEEEVRREKEMAALDEERQEKLVQFEADRKKRQKGREKELKQRRKDRAKRRKELYEQRRRELMDEMGVKGKLGLAEAAVIVPLFCASGGLTVGLISHLKMKAEQDELANLINEGFREAQENSVEGWRKRRDASLTVGYVGSGLALVSYIWYKKSGRSFTLAPQEDAVLVAWQRSF